MELEAGELRGGVSDVAASLYYYRALVMAGKPSDVSVPECGPTQTSLYRSSLVSEAVTAETVDNFIRSGAQLNEVCPLRVIAADAVATAVGAGAAVRFRASPCLVGMASAQEAAFQLAAPGGLRLGPDAGAPA